MISLRYGLHPHLPVKLGFRRLLRLTDPGLARMLDATRAYSITPDRPRVTIYRSARNVIDRDVNGDMAVIGASRGGSAAMLALLLREQPERQLHLFDRWGDLPDPSPEDGFRAEQYRKDRIGDKLADLADRPPLDDARHVMHDLAGLGDNQVRYYPGWFDETLDEEGPYSGRPLAFVLVHCDYYRSVARALAFVDRHMTKGGIALINDYSFWPGSKQATEEYLTAATRPIRLRFSAARQALLHFD